MKSQENQALNDDGLSPDDGPTAPLIDWSQATDDPPPDSMTARLKAVQAEAIEKAKVPPADFELEVAAEPDEPPATGQNPKHQHNIFHIFEKFEEQFQDTP